ncbi:MAG TPA: serine/threonine-protein kinase, partial [Pirellulaceae bacterium]|nr:serine/threonine-protein kinase [Pirellulaceae bacterium]
MTEPAQTDLELTHDSSDAVLYRCTCGAECQVSRQAGCVCGRCGRKVNPQALRYDLSATLDLRSQASGSDAPSVVGNALPEETPSGIECESRGCHLGHFEIVDMLGQGGMAQVYRALDHSLQRYVAVKVLKSKSAASDVNQTEGNRDRLMQEAIAQARVNHPNIVSIYYVGQVDGKRFMAMELVHGEALNQRLARTGPLAFEDIVSIAVQITSALQASARLDLMHGDIKPSNILVQEDGTAKLSDFGLARYTTGPATSVFGGTPNYLAPELMAGGQPSIQSDMYSLGVTLFELSFGRLPKSLSGSSAADWAHSLSQQAIRFPDVWPDHFPREWERILKRLLAPQHEKRYHDYGSLLTELQATMPVKLQTA